MKLYYGKGACSLAAHIALHEAGLTAEIARVDTKTKVMDGGGDFFQVNPKGYVPALALDDGQVLTEVAAVLQYLADLKPASNLAPPAGTMERYRLIEWLAFLSSEVHKGFSPLFSPETPEDYKAVVRTRLARRQAYLNEHLQGRQYLISDMFTVADAYLFVTTRWSKLVQVDIGSFAELLRFQQRVAARPAVQAALQAEGLLK